MRWKSAVAIAGCVAFATPAFAADRSVGRGKQFATIQAAVDAAQAGDRILISPGRYNENVVVTGKAGLAFIGRRGVVWDGTSDADSVRDCLQFTGDGLVVSGIEFRNGSVQVLVTGANAKVSRCIFVNSESDSVRAVGDGAKVERCLVRGSGDSAVEITGARGAVRSCKIQQTDSEAVDVSGDSFTGTSCLVKIVEDGAAFDVSGNSALIAKCKISNCDDGGIDVSGTGARVTGNIVSHTSDDPCIFVIGDMAVVTGNRVSFGASGGIEVTGDQMTVSGNTATEIVDDAAFSLSDNEAGGGTVRDNTATDCREEAFVVGSPNVSLTNCTARGSGAPGGAAFVLSGSGITATRCISTDSDGAAFDMRSSGGSLVACTATSAASDGFRVSASGVTLQSCTARDCSGEGIDNAGTGTVVTGCTLAGNRIDIGRSVDGAWLAPGDVTTRNQFSTGGIDVISEVN
jgi:hypothetical protein